MVLPERSIQHSIFFKHHVSNLFVLQTPPIAPPIAQLPLSSLFLIFFLPFLLHSCPLPPSHFWWVFNCSFYFSRDFVHLFVHHDEFDDCFFYCQCVTTVLYAYGLHGTVVSVHAVYSTVRTIGWCITTVSCACTIPVHPGWYDSFRTPGIHYLITVTIVGVSLKHHHMHVVLQYTPHCAEILVPNYMHRIVCMYTLHAAIQYRLYHVGTTIPRCPVCIHRRVKFVCFANSTLITSFLKLPFLPSSFPSQLLSLPLSCSLSFLVSLSIVVLSFLLIVVLLFVIAPWWIWWSLFFLLSVRHYCIVCTYSTGCMVR